LSNNVQNFPETSPNKKNSSIVRIKSANPNYYDREKLYEENLKFKNDINKFKEILNLQKKENYNLELEINKKDKIIEEMANETQISISNQIYRSNDIFTQKNTSFMKANESKLLINMKRQFKELKRELNSKKDELENLKKTLKITKFNELTIENKIILEESAKLKNLLEISQKQNSANSKNLKENLDLKEINKNKDFLIQEMNEKMKFMQTEIFEKNEEIMKLKKINNDHSEKIKKFKKDLRFQYQINEKLIMSTGNIKESSEYLELKQGMTKKLKEAKKEILYLKEQNSKKEKLNSDLKKFSQNQNQIEKNSTANFLSHKISDENPEEKTNSTLLLIKSKLKEVMKENEKLKNENFEFFEKIKIYENKEYGIENLLKRDTSSVNMNIYNITPMEMENFEKMNENQMNEMIYVLIKNFEANRIDVNILESRLFDDENSMKLLKSGKEKEFCEKLTNLILNLLKMYLTKLNKFIEKMKKIRQAFTL
jgi:hypothetical protein